MTDGVLRKRLNRAVPEMPESFILALRGELEDQETEESSHATRLPGAPLRMRRLTGLKALKKQPYPYGVSFVSKP